jgi:hypothetical protein
MEYARLETALLRDVDETFYYGAECRQCGHCARLSLLKLRAHFGDDYPLAKVRKRLRCEKCGAREVVITFLAANQRTGNLAQLFDRKPAP